MTENSREQGGILSDILSFYMIKVKSAVIFRSKVSLCYLAQLKKRIANVYISVCLHVCMCVSVVVCECAVVPNHMRPVEVISRCQGLFHSTLEGIGERKIISL